MKPKSLIARWVVYQAVITLALLLIIYLSVGGAVHRATIYSLKATLENFQSKVGTPPDIETYFLKNQPALVGLYRPDGTAVYLPEPDLPGSTSEITDDFSKKNPSYLVYTEKQPNGYTYLSFTSRERVTVMERFFHDTTGIILAICFLLACLGTYLLLKRLYTPIDKLALAMDRAFSDLKPLKDPRFFDIDPRVSTLIHFYNQLIETAQKQFVDLTKRKKEQDLILETLEEGICLITSDEKVSFVNAKGLAFLKTSFFPSSKTLFSHSELGQHLELLFHSPLPRPLKEKCSDLNRHFDLTLSSLPDETTLMVIYDETDRIEKLEAGKNFVANASHELRTPITVIRGFAETLLDEQALKHIQLPEVMKKILSACERMDALIKRLLLLADVDQRILEVNRFDIALMLNHELELFKTLHPEATFAYTGPKTCLFSGDEDLLKIVVSNLITNGIKYAHENPHIEISLLSHPTQLEIKVKDNGIGIPEKDLPKIFTRFYRVDKARTRKMGGAGLGLSLVKTIIDKHQGRIEVHSTLGEGTQFTLVLPLSH